MSVCLGVYPDGSQLGPASLGPNAFLTQPGLPVAYVKAGPCAAGDVEVYTRAEVDSAISSGSSSSGSSSGATFTCAGSTCTVVHQVEWVPPDLMSIDLAGGAAISAAVLLVWAVAYGFRAVIRSFREVDGNQPTEENS